MKTLSVIVMFALMGVLLANQLKQANVEEDSLPQEDKMAQFDDSFSQEDNDGQNDVAGAVKLLQEMQNAPPGEKLQSLFWRRRTVFRRLLKFFFPYRWGRYYRCVW